MAGDTRVVLITGATGSLGRAAAAAFARDGDRVGLGGTDLGRLEALAADLELAQDRWAPAVADLREARAATDAIAAVVERLGPVDVLLHLVGGYAGGRALAEVDADELDEMLGQHVWSTFHATRAVIPPMVERGSGRIMAVIPTSAETPAPRSGPYIAAKAAQAAMLRGLAREVADQGVTVNLLVVRAIDAKHERETAPSSKNASWTTPEEAVAVMRFLASPAAAAINGARVPLNGRG